MEYEIIATLGPASQEPSTWESMLACGVSAFRLNTSHLSLDQLRNWLEKLERFFSKVERRCPVVLDLQGSKWRLGQFTAVELFAGDRITLIFGEQTDRPGFLPVPHLDFFQAAAASPGEIVLNDAKIRLELEACAPERLSARVIQGGWISPQKGITYTASTFRKEVLNEKDRLILAETGEFGDVDYAISYVKDAAEMAVYRSLCGGTAHLIAKLERGQAVEEAHQIAQTADALWLCRGDLGAELGAPRMAEAVSGFSARVSEFPKPVFLAGQVLEHMVEHPAPTRSEVCYLYDSLVRGYRGVVLSDETAIGRFPVESCQAAAQFQGRPVTR